MFWQGVYVNVSVVEKFCAKNYLRDVTTNDRLAFVLDF